MQKKNFVSMMMGAIGGILFAIGMCMCLLPEWNAFRPGVVIAAIGAVVFLMLLLVRRRMEGKPAIHLSGKAVGSVLLGIVGALVLGVGDSWNPGGRSRHRASALLDSSYQRPEVRRKRYMTKFMVPTVAGVAALAGIAAAVICFVRRRRKIY